MFYFSNSPKKGFSDLKKIDYNAYWRDRGFEINKKLKEREVIILNAIPAGAKVLDIGCGNSLLPLRLKEKGCVVSVGDISDIVLEAFTKRGIQARHVDLETISTIHLDTTYDYIIMSEVLEHTKNPEEILAELKKYTKHFILTIPNSAFYRYRFHLMFTGTFLRQWTHHPSEHLRYWSHKDFLEWLTTIGFVVNRSEASNGFDLFGLKFYNYFPNMFGHQIVYFVETKL